MEMIVKSPTVKKAKKLKMVDVFGKYDMKTHKRKSKGMIVARSDEKCPVWKDIVPYRSVTVIFKEKEIKEVIYWLEYVHGGESVSRIKRLKGNRIALRSDYQCW